MNLTPEQAAAAEAAGCRFIPAPRDGVHRYAMQRKLFRLDGQEVLATCGGGLYETASTLDQLIAIGRDRLPAPAPIAPPVAAPPADAPAQEPVMPPEAEPVAAAPEPPGPPAPRRRTRTVRVAPSAPEAPADAEPEVPVDIAPNPVSRTRKPASATRWATAGAERRGRTDQHWSKRGR